METFFHGRTLAKLDLKINQLINYHNCKTPLKKKKKKSEFMFACVGRIHE